MTRIHFKEAFEGLLKVIATQTTFKVHLIIAFMTMLGAFYFNFNETNWIILTLTVSMVLTAEAFNTAIEFFADYTTKKRNNSIKLVKDVSAGAVMITVITSVIIGLILFYPKLLILLK